jgi:predicted dehydrogenase
MNAHPRYNVVIIGAGNIGAFYDTPQNEKILTHAHAFLQHTGFKLHGFVDIDFEKSRKAAMIWGVKSFPNIEKAFDYERIDVVCVAVPDDYHYDILKEIAGHRDVKLVVLEKPIAVNTRQAKEIIKIYNNKIEVLVNYSRRFIPEFNQLKNNIKSGLYGKYITGTGYYGKGLLHNGSHMIDLIGYFFEKIVPYSVISYDYDYYKDDPSVNAVLKIDNNSFFIIQKIDCRYYTIFELDLLFEDARIRLTDSGNIIEEYYVTESEIVKGYKNIINKNEIKTLLDDSLIFLTKNVYDHLVKKTKLKCTIMDGYKALKICENIKANL